MGYPSLNRLSRNTTRSLVPWEGDVDLPVRAERSRGYGIRRSARIRPRGVRCAGTISPNCSKRHSTVSLLGAEGTQYTPQRYLQAQPSVLEIEDVLRHCGLEPWDIARVGEPLAVELGLARWPREETDRIRWIEALAAHPIFDPMVSHHPDDETAVAGRSPDSVRVCSAIGVCVDPLIRRLDAARRSTFEVTIVASGDQVRAAVLDREAHGALVMPWSSRRTARR